MVSHSVRRSDARPDRAGLDRPEQGAPRHAQLFPLDQLDELVEKAAALNAEKRNVYIGATLRKEGTPPFGRTMAEDFFAAPALWADHGR